MSCPLVVPVRSHRLRLPMPHPTDTIAAVATARGQAALAVVRASGPDAVAVAARCFGGADLRAVPSHTVHVGYVEDADGRALDQVVATVFRAPRSATGEDVVELSCHGGDFASRLVLEALLDAGARMARPGEFTQRAFLNGKLDLAQAEAVADLIHASSSLAHRVSVRQLQGRYSRRLGALRRELLDLCAFLELELDFSEEDVAFADRARLEGLLGRAEGLVQTLLDSYALGEKVRDGVQVVIGGRPNAGKSTLLNALVGRERAIVSAVPGTTRDAVEAEAEIEGLRFRFTDTAGLRATADAVEAEGVRRARRAIEGADVVVYVYDLAAGLADEDRDLLREVRTARPALPLVLVGNKQDLLSHGPALPEAPSPGVPHLCLSALHAQDADEEVQPLVRLLLDTVADGLAGVDASPVVTNQRHRRHLRAALDALGRARRALDAGLGADLLALDLRAALDELGAITGAVTNEDVLGTIFSRFCIGK